MPITLYSSGGLKKLLKTDLRLHIVELYKFIEIFDMEKIKKENEELKKELDKIAEASKYGLSNIVSELETLKNYRSMCDELDKIIPEKDVDELQEEGNDGGTIEYLVPYVEKLKKENEEMKARITELEEMNDKIQEEYEEEKLYRMYADAELGYCKCGWGDGDAEEWIDYLKDNFTEEEYEQFNKKFDLDEYLEDNCGKCGQGFKYGVPIDGGAGCKECMPDENCDCENCGQHCGINDTIFIFQKPEGGETQTFCEPCGTDLKEEMNKEGWVRDDESDEEEEEEVKAYCPKCGWEGNCMVSPERAKELKELDEMEDIGDNDFCGCNEE
tara:strand:+ start:3832 stop:4815 length:984 start_codon:yes stop_codon:yes gene_type:complete